MNPTSISIIIVSCCFSCSVFTKFADLDSDISKKLFGQHLVKDVVVNAIKSHWYNDNPSKPLVLSFHGYTGSGKNFVAEMIANNTFK